MFFDELPILIFVERETYKSALTAID